MEYIFLSGIHGVGKTTLANRLKNIINIKSMSVSDLIRKAGKKLDNTKKNIDGISKNQDLWKKELNNIDIGDSKLLLDGHFCLLDIDENITRLPFSTFYDTNMTKIVLMKNNPYIIRDRLLSRDKKEYSIDLIDKFQQCEVQQAINYSTEKKVNLFIFDQDESISKLADFITT
ncbi:ATP-binding protein [Peribacillus sp. NPDC096622]|uniref:ATP-binding protein n=1 Tax=Peribacillus sp. NPDC096622 TaxID=3364396 RepID=UPI00381611DE